MSWLIRSLAFQQDCFRSAEKSKHFTRRAVASLPVLLLTSSSSPVLLLPSLRLILDTYLFNFPSNCFVSNVSLSRHKRQGFFKNQNGFLIRFSILSTAEISKLKFLSRKAPWRIDPFVSFLLFLLRNRRKNRQRTGSEKRKVMGVTLWQTHSRKLNRKNDGTQRKKESSVIYWGKGKDFFILFG